MPDEVVTIRNRGIDITHACIEVIQANSPAGDRAKIVNIKQIIRAQAEAAEEPEEQVAMKLLLSAFQAYLDEVKEESALKIVSTAVRPN